MGYYTIYILHHSNDIETIVTEFVKFRYNRILVFMCTSGGIFQAKLDKHLSYIGSIKVLIKDILVLIKD